MDYDVAMQLLKYMTCIWLEYSKEVEQKSEGVSGRKSFRYPVIIPVVYYEGKKPWTADRHFRDRIAQSSLFPEWIPDFCYEVVSLHDYSNEELLERGNEMSLIMLFNKIQDVVDLSEFLKLPQEKLNRMIKDTPEAILNIIITVMENLCMKVGASKEETVECVQRVKERRMGYMFENMEKMNIQEERKKTARAEKKAERAEKKAEQAEKKAEQAEKKAEKKARETIIEVIVSICQEKGISKEETIDKVMEKCQLNKKTAEKKVDLYWKEIL